MKNIFRNIGFVILLVLSIGLKTYAQTSNFKLLNNEIQTIQKQLVPDKRVAILNILLADTIQPVIKVKGETNLPDGKAKIVKLLNDRGIQFVDSIRVLPEASLGEKVWAIGTLSVANIRSGPDHAAEMVTQVLMGMPLKVLAKKEGWVQVQSPDEYIGWVDELGIALKTEAEMTAWKQSKRFVFNEMTGYAFSAPKKNAPYFSDFVLGNLFELVSEAKGFLQVQFPDGRIAFVKKRDCISFQEWISRPVDLQSILSVANQLLGVPYMWGGTSCKAVDCSGFTKTAYYSQAIILARDASQQARYGEHPDFNDHKNLRPGDLLFFGRTAQRITHVGLYLGNEDYINASGFVRVNSIDPNDPKFKHNDPKSLVSASRILNSLNTNGIIQVKNHPWYSIINQQ